MLVHGPSIRASGCVGLGVLAVIGCSGDAAPSSSPLGQSSAALAPSQEAQAWLADLRGRFVLTPPALPVAPTRLPSLSPQPRALLESSKVEGFEHLDGHLVAKLPAQVFRGITRPARVRLPERADGAFELTDEASGMRLSVTRVGAHAATVEEAEGWAVYRGGAGEGDVLHRVHAEGTEDYVHFAHKPAKEELRYRVDVSAVAGLRLVSKVLEFVNAKGDPRLRMKAPLAVDEKGQRHGLTIAVEGCAFSRDPASPWGKLVTAPGASQCEVVVSWEGSSYPLLVDPSWTASGSMTQFRNGHTSSTLPDGRVLVVGGVSSPQTSEVWDQGTFAVSGNTTQQRHDHTANTLPDGRILVVGGGFSSQTSEVWSNGVFAASVAPMNARQHHTASSLPDERVLIVGGDTKTSEARGPRAGGSPSWSASASLSPGADAGAEVRRYLPAFILRGIPQGAVLGRLFAVPPPEVTRYPAFFAQVARGA